MRVLQPPPCHYALLPRRTSHARPLPPPSRRWNLNEGSAACALGLGVAGLLIVGQKWLPHGLQKHMVESLSFDAAGFFA